MYFCIKCKLQDPAEENAEIVTAFLSEYALDYFQHEGDYLSAYTNDIPNIDILPLEEIEENISTFIEGKIQLSEIQKENWNSKWEKEFFEPIEIENTILIRAPFHSIDKAFPIEIIIEPKMSFGTGHHSTTQLMCSFLLEFREKITNSAVMDMGAGTGVLAIVADKLGAAKKIAIDIEVWAQENAIENFEKNNCTNYQSFCGDASMLNQFDTEYFDIFLANIQKNVLIQDVNQYTKKIKPNGLLFVSGFYIHDLEDIQEAFIKHNANLISYKVKNDWCAAAFKMKNDPESLRMRVNQI